ncbi:MAG: HNH endonuclease [Ktedonobacteraceae bacterium]|nr:HNH endonuclease [Ktedonobacteraceae bacterium]
MQYIRLFAIIAVLTVVLSGCNVSVNSTGTGYPGTTATAGSSGPSGPTGAEPNWGVQTKTSGCVAHNGLADSACTPGALLPQGTKDAICQSGYSRSVRNVPISEKDQVYAEYGIASRAPGEYEVDHLVSLELGGSNDISNLWPELASPQPGFHQKDQVENYLHAQVCSGAISLKEAQIEIATNWLAVYDRMPKA